MKKTIAMLLVLAIVMGSVFAQGASEGTQEKMLLRYSESNSVSDERALADQYFCDLVKERTNGRIEITLYAGGQLGGNKDVTQSLQLGAIDMTTQPISALPGWGMNAPWLTILSLPFLFKDVDHAVRVMNSQIGEQFMEDINNSGFGVVALDIYCASARNFFAKKPINSLADMKGMKFRVQEGEIYVDIVKAFGASSTPLDQSEIYSALQTGVVDGADQPVKGYYNNKYYEVGPYYSWSNYMIQPSTILISKITWDKLSDADKAIFKQAAAEATVYFQDLLASKLQSNIEALKAAGVTFCDLTDYADWVAAVQPVYDKYGAGYQDLIKSIQAID